MNLKILNFQSIKDVDLDINGFIVIKGKSNSGKSSIRRAINSLFFNDWDKSFVRKGTKKTELFLEHGSNSIKLSKPSNSYEINGDIFPKVGIKVPEEISDIGIKMFETEAESINLIAPSQLDQLFMISYSDQINTRILNKIFNVQKYRLASAKAKKDNDNNSRDMKTLKEMIADNKAEHGLEQSMLEKALEIKELMTLIDKIDEIYDLNTETHNLKLLINTIDSRIVYIEKLTAVELYTITSNELTTLNDKILSVTLQTNIIEDSLQVCNIDIVIDVMESLSDTKKLILNNINKMNILDSIGVILLNTTKIDDIIDYDTHLGLLKNIDTTIANVNSATSIVKKIDLIKSETKYIDDFIIIMKSVNSINSEIKSIDNNIAELQSKIKLMPVCECCGQFIEHL